MHKMLSDKKRILTFLLPALLVYCFTVIIPIFWSLYYSFFYWDGITPMRFVGVENFAKLASDIYFKQAFFNNLIYVLINLVGQVFVGLLVALLLTHLTEGKDLIKTLYFAPTILSTIAIAQVFAKFYAVDPPGILNVALQGVGLGNLTRAWLGNEQTSLACVAVIECYKNMGLYMVIIYSGLVAVPHDVLEAAQIDGASGLQLFTRIKMAYLRPVLVVAMVMAVNGLLKAFDIPYIATYGGPGSSSELVTTYMYKTAFTSAKYGYGSAIAVFVAVECMVAVSLLRAFMNRKQEM